MSDSFALRWLIIAGRSHMANSIYPQYYQWQANNLNACESLIWEGIASITQSHCCLTLDTLDQDYAIVFTIDSMILGFSYRFNNIEDIFIICGTMPDLEPSLENIIMGLLLVSRKLLMLQFCQWGIFKICYPLLLRYHLSQAEQDTTNQHTGIMAT